MKKINQIFILILLLFFALNIAVVSAWSFDFITGKVVDPNQDCIDSDGGKNYYVKGTTYGTTKCVNQSACSPFESTDYCENDKQLLEFFCENNFQYVDFYNCPNGCSNGACLSEGQKCNPAWKCKNESHYGFQNSNCNWINTTYCEAGCSQDTCHHGYKCKDTDQGKNYSERGITTVNKIKYSDYCIIEEQNFGKLQEFYCKEDGTLGREIYECPMSCNNGTCINKNISWKCTDSDGSRNFYSKGKTYGMMNNQIKEWIDYCIGDNFVYDFSCKENGISVQADSFKCPNGCEDGTCINITPDSCSDGTLFNQCSISKPKFCLEGELVDKCEICGCPTNAFCLGNGSCQRIPKENKKNGQMYSNKEVFLVSDEIWKNVLPLVPVGTWTDENDVTHKHPLLIYHKEKRDYISLSGEAMKNNRDLKIKIDGKPVRFHHRDAQVVLGNIFLSDKKLTLNEEFQIELYLFNPQNSTVHVDYIEIGKWPLDDYIQPKDSEGNRIYINRDFEPNQYDSIKFTFEVVSMPKAYVDMDSIVYFVKQYHPDKITFSGKIPKKARSLLTNASKIETDLEKEDIRKITTKNYLSYWKEYKNVIYVEKKYELSLMASTYASLINAPLVIENTSLDKDDVFLHRNITCVGDVNRDCDQHYDLKQLQEKYLKKTDTDKVILVNPNDLDTGVSEILLPEMISTPVNRLYSKTSLSAPILASAKHELILNIDSNAYKSVNTTFKNQLNSLGISPNYLTIIASPGEIPNTRKTGEKFTPLVPTGTIEEIDNHIYSDLDGDFFQEISTGRIFGLTLSDVSSQINRGLFYNDIDDFNSYILTSGDISVHMVNALASESLLKSAGFSGVNAIDVNSTITDIDLLKNKSIILYWGHGTSEGLQKGITSDAINSVWLNPSMMIADACSSCDFSTDSKSDLFCTNVIRRGALAYIGAVHPSGTETSPSYLVTSNIVLNHMDLGNVFKLFKNKENIVIASPVDYKRIWIGKNWTYRKYEPHYILLGDPTFTFPKKTINLNQDEKTEINFDSSDNIITLNVPQTENIFFHTKIRLRHLFELPLGGNTVSSIKEWYTIHQDQREEKIVNDMTNHVFYLDFLENKRIVNISKIEYYDANGSKVISEIPVYDTGDKRQNKLNIPEKSNKIKNHFIFFYKDDEVENRYWFHLVDSLGGKPPFVTKDQPLPSYRFKIYLNTKNQTSAKLQKKVTETEPCDGCLYENTCIPYGIRKENRYCDFSGNMLELKKANENCDNNYECQTNVCVNNRCISGDLFQMFLEWLSKILRF